MLQFRKVVWLLAVLLAATMLALVSLPLIAQQNPRRLVLKDGSYQAVTRWEIAGNRVRYYSAERFTWEEMPSELVDWPATDKYNRERSSQLALKVGEAAKDKDEDVDEADAPLAAPGLRLPDGGGVFLLDVYQDRPGLVELEQNGAELNRHTGRNILRAAINPLSLSSKQTIELPGEHAKVQSHLMQPAIYISVDPGDNSNQPAGGPAKAEDPTPQHYRIVRVEKKNGMRVVGDLNVAIYGKVSQKEHWINTTNTPVGTWIKVTPAAELAPGEYAVVELLEKSQVNLFVWDFGVDPSAPANPNAWTPRQSDPSRSNEPPVLERRPK